jgi:hypothetical protein
MITVQSDPGSAVSMVCANRYQRSAARQQVDDVEGWRFAYVIDVSLVGYAYDVNAGAP